MTSAAQTIKEVAGMATDGMKEAVTAIMPYLEKVAEQLGTTAQYLWMLQIKQGYILAASLVIKFIVSFFIIRLVYRKVCGWRRDVEEEYNKDDRRHCDRPPVELLFVFPFLGIGIWIYNFWSDLNLILTLIFNTDYWAIGQIIQLIKANVQL